MLRYEHYCIASTLGVDLGEVLIEVLSPKINGLIFIPIIEKGNAFLFQYCCYLLDVLPVF